MTAFCSIGTGGIMAPASNFTRMLPAGARHWVMVFLFWLVSASALAAPATCTQNIASVTVSMPASISIPRDATIGTPLTAWVSSGTSTRDWFRCTDYSPKEIGALMAATSTSNSGVILSDGGISYPVLRTNLDGVGIAIGFESWVAGCGYSPILPVGTQSTGYLCNSAGTWTYGGAARFRLVKTGTATSGTVGGEVVANAQMWLNGTLNTAMTTSFYITPTKVTSLTCITPDLTVPMGSHRRMDFDAAGAKSPAVDVNIALRQCPAGMQQIQYRVEPLSQVVDASNGIVTLSAGSTARGIALQLLNADGTGFALGSDKVFGDYRTATGGDHVIKLKARYVKTGEVTAGTANAVMSLVMTYY